MGARPPTPPKRKELSPPPNTGDASAERPSALRKHIVFSVPPTVKTFSAGDPAVRVATACDPEVPVEEAGATRPEEPGKGKSKGKKGGKSKGKKGGKSKGKKGDKSKGKKGGKTALDTSSEGTRPKVQLKPRAAAAPARELLLSPIPDRDAGQGEAPGDAQPKRAMKLSRAKRRARKRVREQAALLDDK